MPAQTLENDLRAAIRQHLRQAYQLETTALAVESPPRPDLGDFALPVCFELAKTLRCPPRKLAEEIASQMALPPGFERLEAAGGGYLNVFVDRRTALMRLAADADHLLPALTGKVIVEHTNINPNKAAHIGHLRNAVLGDTWVRLLRHHGEQVEVQNLQDNTGVQVADVVAAFLYLGETPGNVAAAAAAVERALADAERRFDYLCWDKYAAISQRYADDANALAEWRPACLHAIEAGGNAVAALAERIASAIAGAHLRTMDRIQVRYDVLPRESEILQLHLWDHAFQLLQDRHAVRLETVGKNAGCWVMDRPGDVSAEGEDETKVIVRSNGTVTYVAKDIAYQLWKFGLLPLAFAYRRFYEYPEGAVAWRTAAAGETRDFGDGQWVFNVIDVRQSYLQEVVTSGLRALGYQAQAEHSIHFSYEMVALSADCARELGYEAEGGQRVDVSGRKGTGVKADDLIDRLRAHTLREVEQRHPEMSAEEREKVAGQIAVCALRYFLLKYTRTTVIAFDFKEALSFEGETGPYVQYAAVRAANILRKAGMDPGAGAAAGTGGEELLRDESVWSLVWTAARLNATVAQCVAAREPAQLAKYAFQLAQQFNNFYHHQPVLQEADAARRGLLLSVVGLVYRQLARTLDVMGIAVPAAM